MDREQLEWMYGRYVGAPAGGDTAPTLEDHLHRALACHRARHGPPYRALVTGLPLLYAEAVFTAAREGGEKGE